MQQIIYISKAAMDFSPEALAGIQKQAAAKNAGLLITGLLLFRQGYFCQLIEGPPLHLQALYAKIRYDPRHQQVTTLLERSITKRAFPKWDMLLMNLDLSGEFPAFDPLPPCQAVNQRYAATSDDPQWAFDLLLTFISPFSLRTC
jgi:hypothetical protein